MTLTLVGMLFVSRIVICTKVICKKGLMLYEHFFGTSEKTPGQAAKSARNRRNEPSISDLCRIADFFNVSVDYLVGRTENMMSHKSPELHKLLNNITLFDIMSAVQHMKNDMEG